MPHAAPTLHFAVAPSAQPSLSRRTRRLPPGISRALVSLLVGLVPILLASVGARLDADEFSRILSTRNAIRARMLERHVTTLADDTFEGREAGSRGGRAAGTYLLQQFRQSLETIGGRVQVQSFGAGYRNLLGILEGNDPARKQEFLLIGAHYDHVGYGTARNSFGPLGRIHNGADDNASGTAAVLTILEAFRSTGYQPSRSILFALWDAEEKGMLGSKHWVNHPTVPRSQLKLAINLDMVGRLRNQHVEVLGTRSMAGLRSLVSRANQGLALRLDFVWPLEPNGDHHTFFSHQIPVVMFHTGLHDQYHRPSDDSDFINTNGLEEVSQLVFSTLAEAAESPLSEFRSESRHEGQFAQQAFEQPLPRPEPRLGLSWSNTPTESGGLQVTSVRSNSPADRAGIRVGDLLLQFGDQPIASSEAFQRAVLQSGAEVTLQVQREEAAEPVTLPVRLAGARLRLGLSWRENSGEPGTVTVIRVVPHSPAEEAGLLLGDRIHRLGGKSFSDSHQFGELARSLTLPLELQIERKGQLQAITLR